MNLEKDFSVQKFFLPAIKRFQARKILPHFSFYLANNALIKLKTHYIAQEIQISRH